MFILLLINFIYCLGKGHKIKKHKSMVFDYWGHLKPNPYSEMQFLFNFLFVHILPICGEIVHLGSSLMFPIMQIW